MTDLHDVHMQNCERIKQGLKTKGPGIWVSEGMLA